MTASPAITQDQTIFTPDLHAKATDDYANDAASLEGTEDPGPCSCCNKVKFVPLPTHIRARGYRIPSFCPFSPPRY